MYLYKYYAKFNNLLKKNKYYSQYEIENLFLLLTCNILKCTKIDIYLKIINKEIISNNYIQPLEKGLFFLKKNKPIQYIIGKTKFLNLSLKINNQVFIPRPETEELVNWLIKDYNYNIIKKKLNILDIGTGSGCIAIYIKKNIKESNIYALDVCKKALNIAKLNALKYNLKIYFYNINILTSINLINILPYIDIIISNPPYVRSIEKKYMHPNVYKYEPNKAIFVTNKYPLIFYQKILEISKYILNKKGYIYLEINKYLSNQMISLIKKIGYNHIYLKKDIYNNYRMIRIQKK